jgi:DNA-binding transcriptional ArsR family regulator
MTKSILEKAISEGLSTYEIAERFGMGQTNIRYWLRKYGLNTNHLSTSKDRRNCLNGHNCKNCDIALTGAKIMYCNDKCKLQYHYNNDSIINGNTNDRQKRISKERKLELIKLAGGKCMGCGYNKNYAALQFHHRNPEDKIFSLDSRKLSNTKWESILIESKKCDLLCANCHIELHNPLKILE